MATREEIIASIGQLPVTPRIIRHLSAFLRDPNADFSPAIDALKAEPVLTAAILAACNAPQHFRGAPVLDLEAAVRRLGYRETYRIALLITFRQGLRLASLPDSKAADYLWRRAVVAACAMEELAEPGDAPAGYTVGLLHLLGCFVIASQGVPIAATHPAALSRAQEEACGIAYPEAGAVALEQWGFPPDIVEPIRWQFAPDRAGGHQAMALQLLRAVSVARFVEECRVRSVRPLDEGEVEELRMGGVLHSVEERATALIESFHLPPLP